MNTYMYMYYHRHPVGQREITGFIPSDQMIWDMCQFKFLKIFEMFALKKKVEEELTAAAHPDISLNKAFHEKHPWVFHSFSCLYSM